MPIISRSPSAERHEASDNGDSNQALAPRAPAPVPVPEPKGGGGHSGGHSGGHARGGGGKASSPPPPVGSKGAPVAVSGSKYGSSATSYGPGSTKREKIPSGEPFAGRTRGGGTRENVYGTPYVSETGYELFTERALTDSSLLARYYGSGYPGQSGGLGVAGRDFPYVYWPVVYDVPSPGYRPSYLYPHEVGPAFSFLRSSATHVLTLSTPFQYGKPNNKSRIGGPEMQATFASRSPHTSTFHILSDNSTIVALIASIRTNCSSKYDPARSSTRPAAYTGAGRDPQPEQAVQYYRASSVVLTLDGYNDTAVLRTDGHAPAAPLPLPANVDRPLLNCLNATIGESVPLFNGADGQRALPGMMSVVILVFVMHVVRRMF